MIRPSLPALTLVHVHVLVLVLEGQAGAQAPAVDLRVRHEPAREVGSLQMRDGLQSSGDVAPGSRTSTSTSTGASTEIGYQAIPSSWRDVQERVIFKLNVGFGLDSGSASGEFGKNGVVPTDVTDPDGNEFTESRQYLLGDAVLGSRGVLLPSMNTYFQSQFRLDADGASAFASMNNVYDTRDGRALLVRAGYAEIDGYGEEGTALHKLYVRAGRQYRYGSTRFITNFDGVTAGYDDAGYEVSGFVGQRVSLFFDDDKGIVGGVGVKARGKELANVPVDVAVDYLSFDGDVSLLEVNSRFDWFGLRSSLYARFADTGDGMGLGRFGGSARKVLRKAVVTARFERIGDGDPAYDYISPTSGDVVNVSNEVRLGLPERGGAYQLYTNLLYMLTRDIEGYAFYRLRQAFEPNAFESDNQEVGVALRAALGRNTRVGGQYKLRARSIDEDAQAAGSAFDDTAGAGVTAFHELSGEARYSLGAKKATTAFGAYLRVYDVESPYAEVTTDSRAGARFDADYWVSKQARVKAAGEIAQPSPTFAAEIGTMTSIRLLLEAVF